MKHLHTLGVLFGFKTGQACCGRRVKLADMAVMEDADCPECREAAEAQHRTYTEMLDAYDKAPNLPRNSELVDKLREQLKSGPVYRNALYI